MKDAVKVGHIRLDLVLAPDGDMLVLLHEKGEIALVTKLGMLELGKDTLLALTHNEQ